MDPNLEKFARIFPLGKPVGKDEFQLLAGRVLRGRPGSNDFSSMSPNVDRSAVMLVNARTLGEMVGAGSMYQIGKLAGWSHENMAGYDADGLVYKLVVFPETSSSLAVRATWQNMRDLACRVYPAIATVLHRFHDELVRTPYAEIVRRFRGGKMVTVSTSAPTFMSAVRLASIRNPDLGDVRQFYFDALYMKELYAGDGWTWSDTGVIPNMPLAQLGEHILIDLPALQMPSTKKLGRALTRGELPLPAHYEAANAARWTYGPSKRVQDDATDWAKIHGIKPASTDKDNVHFLVIDAQKSFCMPDGELWVAGRSGQGAVDDSKRLAECIYRNLGRITAITTTMDTHFAYQIFFPSFWLDRDGKHPPAHTEITTSQIDAGDYRPNPAMAKWLCGGNYPWLMQQVRYYCEELEKAGKYKLYLWPPHCLLGSEGHALVGVIHEARMFQAFARGAQSLVEIKGGNPLTENYSVMQPEVITRFDGQPLAQKNTLFLKTLLDADMVVIAGQAASHCVKSSIDDILTAILAKDPALAKKVYLLTDCMSSVTVPDGKGGFVIDYTPEAEKALKRFADAGMHCVRSTDPMDQWG